MILVKKNKIIDLFLLVFSCFFYNYIVEIMYFLKKEEIKLNR